MKKKHASCQIKTVLVMLVWAGAAGVQGEIVFTDDYGGDGNTGRFVIEAEHYSSRRSLPSEGWWEVDGESHKFIEGPADGEDAPPAEHLRAGGSDTGSRAPTPRILGEREYSTAREVRIDLASSTTTGYRIGADQFSFGVGRVNREARGNYMVARGVSVYPVAPTDSSYGGAFMDYRVAAPTPGDYRLYARWFGQGQGSDSFYALVLKSDGTVLRGVGPEYFIFHRSTGGWRWDSRGVENTPYSTLQGNPAEAVWTIKEPGQYVIRAAQREFDTALDALVFQTRDLPSPENSTLAESRVVDQPVENKEIVAIRVRLLGALEQRLEALQRIDEALARETLLYESLDSLLAGGEYGGLSRWNVAEAKQKVGRMINTEKRSREALCTAIEQLEGALLALGWTPPPPPKPVAYWSFDEGYGAVVCDSAGDNNGTIYGATWTEGRFGSALSFDGVDDYVEVNDHPSLRFMQSSSFTVSCWIMPLSESDSGHIVSKMRGKGQRAVFGYHIQWSPASSAFAFSAESSWKGAVSAKTAHDAAPAGSWYHLVGLYSDNDVRIYLNGELANRQTFDFHTGSTTPDKNLVIGALSYDSTLSRFFGGKIDEVCIYDGALSEAEIRALYQRGS